MLKKRLFCIQAILACCVALTSCATGVEVADIEKSSSETTSIVESSISESNTTVSESSTESSGDGVTVDTPNLTSEADSFSLSSVPAYSGEPYCIINNNIPYFVGEKLIAESYEYYSPLDEWGRCGVTEACIGVDIMPTEERGSIGNVKPTGWYTVKYDCVDGKYLYNRCHLIGYQLTGENANTSNLITGTRYMNVDGMLPFENMVADYVKETNQHVMYRSTPCFEGDNLLASGVLLEAMSVEDNGEGLMFNVYIYNVQPDIEIDYATGESWLAEETTTSEEGVTIEEPTPSTIEEPAAEEPVSETPQTNTYVLNTNTKKVHKPSCSSVDTIKESNRQDYEGTLEELEAQGYTACGRCHPF